MMKRIQEESPVKGYQLFRYLKVNADGTETLVPNYYIRHRGKDTCTKTDRLQDQDSREEASGGRMRSSLEGEPRGP